MSDYRAIAGVTGTLQQFLNVPLSAAIPGTTVRAGPPSSSLASSSVAAANIFLYQVNPNPSFRNAELPVRRSDGSVLRRPQAALDLYYLLSFYGPESKMVPQLLLGAAVSALHAHPKLDPGSIPEALDGKSLAECGLHDQAQVIEFILIPLSHEELARIWSVFFQVPYTLSIAYRCSVVLLEPELHPEPALPVLETRLAALPWAPASLDRVEPPVVEFDAGAIVRLEGSGLSAPATSVEFDGVSALPSWITDEALEVPLPGGIAAGVRTARVVHERPSGNGRSSLSRSRSNPVSFVVVPRLLGEITIAEPEAVEGGSRATVRVAPEVRPGQSVALLLNEYPPPEDRPARSYALRPVGEGARGERFEFRLGPVESGAYLARIEVDGVPSRPELSESAARGPFARPRIEIP